MIGYASSLTDKVRGSKAFSLLELIIVAAIVGTLAAIVIPNLLEAQTRAKISRVKNDQRTLATALESYSVDNNGAYPPAAVVTGPGEGHLIYPRAKRLRPLTTPIAYLTSIPIDPFKKTQFYIHLDRASYIGSGQYSTDPQSVLRGTEIPRFLGGADEWVLLSRGSSGERTDLSFINDDDMYDPTNGTVSADYVMRWGP